MTETWKAISGYEKLYEASSLGRIRNARSGRIRKSSLLRTGYLSLMLHSNGLKKHHKVHRLVAAAFHPNPENLSDVHHKDSDKTNNAASNLEWVTRQQNILHSVAAGTHRPKNQNGTGNNRAILTDKQVIWMRRLYSEFGLTSYQLAEIYNISRVHVGRILRRANWTHI